MCTKENTYKWYVSTNGCTYTHAINTIHTFTMYTTHTFTHTRTQSLEIRSSHTHTHTRACRHPAATAAMPLWAGHPPGIILSCIPATWHQVIRPAADFMLNTAHAPCVCEGCCVCLCVC